MHMVLFELHLFKIQSLNLVHDDQKKFPLKIPSTWVQFLYCNFYSSATSNLNFNAKGVIRSHGSIFLLAGLKNAMYSMRKKRFYF